MPAFKPQNPDDWGRLDWQMLRFGYVTLYSSTDLLDRNRAWLRAEGYRDIVIDLRGCAGTAEVMEYVNRALGFPGTSGGSLDGIDDWMYNFIEGEYGADPNAAATSITILGFDAFRRTDARAATILIEIFGRHASRALMFGHRMPVLVHSADPNLQLGPMGGEDPHWNHGQWDTQPGVRDTFLTESSATPPDE